MRTVAQPQKLPQNSATSATAQRGAVVDAGLKTPSEARLAHRLDQISIRPRVPGITTRVGVQRKLKVGDAHDGCEQEADRIAREMAGPPDRHQGVNAPPVIQRFAPLSGSSEEAPDSVEQTLRRPGLPLEPNVREEMERRFSHDFSRVRVYGDRDAARSASDVNANAYTVGHQIVFGTDHYAPSTAEGRRLLLHELTHVVQQGAAGPWAGRGHEPAPLHAQPQRSQTSAVLARQPVKGTATSDANIALARALSKKLAAGKQDDVLATVEDPKTDLAGLELAAARALDKPKADELRRIIRFARHKPAAEKQDKDKRTEEVVRVTDAGKAQGKTTKVPGGTVEIHTGVSFKSGAGNSTEAYSLTFAGTNVDDMRWLQFIWRELVPEFPAATKGGVARKEPRKGPLSHSDRDYELTTNPARPSWNTDSGTKRSPFYEANTTAKRTATELTMFDAPSPMIDDVKGIFKSASSAPTHVISHFHATTYLVHRMNVLYRAEIDVVWDFTSKDATPAAKVTATGKPASHVDAAQHSRLKAQEPNVDYLAGPASDPLGEFSVVQDLFPAKSLNAQQWKDAKTSDEQRFKDILAIAHGEWFNEASGMGPTAIHIATNKTSDIKPGLNYFSKLTVPGEAGYIDSKGVYHNPDLPIEVGAELPRIAIILGPIAFARDKDWALDTLRHELRHAAHQQLTVRWLLKWREAGAGKKTFKAWLDSERQARRISATDAALVSTGIPVPSPTGPTMDLTATEVFAYTEGMIAALPFLPAKPDLQLIANDRYPATIRAIKEGQNDLEAGSTFTPAAFELVHDAACELGQRDALSAWLDFLIKPSTLAANTAADKQTIAMVKTDFGSRKKVIEQLRTAVRKACK